MGALLLMSGTKGKRFALPNSRIMIHQPSGGMTGTAADIEIQAKEIIALKKICNTIISEKTGQSIETIIEDSERDFYMSPKQAVDYGLIDKIAEKKPPVATSTA